MKAISTRLLSSRSLSLALAVAAGLMSPCQALAAGMIMVDPQFAPMPIRTGHIGIVRPGPRPNPTPRPPVVTTPVLHGGVSFGLRLQAQDIKVDISDQVARTYIEQTFINDGDQNVAGTYLFPLPEDTTFSSFSLHIDGKPVEGKILEAKEARAQYEEIVRRMVDPGLLEYADYKTVRARIFPIPAHGTKKVTLEYTQILKAENGLVKYRFPLKGDSAAQGDVENTNISVKLSGKQGLRTIWSPSHTVDLKREDNNRAKVAFVGQNGNGVDKDFMLYYSVSDKEVQANLLTSKNEGEDGYFLLTLAPPVKNAVVQSKDIVLVADTSGSMAGQKMDETKKALKYVVNALAPGDRFGIVQFNTDADAYKSTLVQATPENKKSAAAFIDDLEARGGTNISGALNSGASLLNNGDTRPAYLVLMTDGEPTVGETSLDGLLKTVKVKRDLRLFDFGVGYDVNTRLLNRLAEDHHGTSQFLDPGENLESALAAFYNKIKSPVLSDCQISYNGITTKDVYPRAVTDIFAGTQVLLMGRYKGAGKATVSVTGKVNGVAKAYSFPVDFASTDATHGYLPRLWAMRRIAHLTDVAQQNGDTREIVDEIVALSQKYGIITAYTSFLVTDPSENTRLPNRGGVPSASIRRVSAGNMPGSMPMASANGFSSFGGLGGGGGTLRGRAVDRTEPSAAPSAQEGMSRWTFKPNVWGAKGKTNSAWLSAAKTIAVRDDSATSGQDAVTGARHIAMLKDSKELPAAQNALKKEMKQAEGKTFYLDADGQTWMDSQYNGEKVEEIKFASARYFDLAKTSPQLASYLAIGKQVTFVFAGHAYKVTV